MLKSKSPFREMEPSVTFHHQHGPFDLPKVVAVKIQKTPPSPIHKTNNKPAPLEREQNKKVHKKKEMRWCSKFPFLIPSIGCKKSKTYPQSLLKNSECFTSALSLHCHLVRFLQHLFEQVLSVYYHKTKKRSTINSDKSIRWDLQCWA